MIALIHGNESHLGIIAAIAEKTWAITYKKILSPNQARYMLDTLYSREGLLRAMNSNAQKFILVKNNRAFQGFASYGLRENSHTVFKLHKLYVLPTSQGKGFGKLLIDEVKKEVLLQGGSMLDLNVNRDNPAKEFYKKLGFRIIREEDNAIGEYWMNDYVMRIDLKG